MAFRRRTISICCAVLFVLFTGQTNKPVDPNNSELPASLTKKLDSLKQADDLSNWLYAYREYINEDAASRIPFLATAQSKAWRSCKNDAEREEWFSCLTMQGYYFLYAGNILRSIEAYEAAYRFYFDGPPANADLLEYVLKPLGNNYTRLGDYDRAFFIQEKALALAKQSDSSQIASICHNLATTAIWKADLSLAKKYCEEGLKSVKPRSPVHGLLLSTNAEVLLRSGNIAAAESNVRQAINILRAALPAKETTSAAYWLRGALQGLGDIQKEKKEPAAALRSYEDADAIIDKYYNGERKREKAQLMLASGKVLLQLKQTANAEAHFDEALSLLIPSYHPFVDSLVLPGIAELYGENTIIDALHGKADCFAAMGKKEAALQTYLLLFPAEKKLRREFFSSSARQQQQKENRQWAESAMEVAAALWEETHLGKYADAALRIAELSKSQLLLDEIAANVHYSRANARDSLLDKQQQLMQAITYNQREAIMNADPGKTDSNAMAALKEMQYQLSLLQKQVRQKYPALEVYDDSTDISTVGLLKLIPTDTRLVEFFAGEKQLYIISAGSGVPSMLSHIDSGTVLYEQVKHFVDGYFQSGPQAMMNDPAKYYHDAWAVYSKIWEQRGAPQQKYLVIPDGILGYLPFDALVTDSNYKTPVGQWPFLVDRSDLSYCYSLQTLGRQKAVQYPNTNFAGFFISFDSSDNASLPAVKQEEAAIKDIVAGDFFSDKQASLSSFNKKLGDVNVLHISTHSFLQGKENIPALQLSGDRFFLFELYGKHFQPQLVVLSACRTGHGMLAEGEGIISLARGFTAAGAGGIVAGMWNMNDGTTAGLIGRFYEELGKGAVPAAALRSAKLKWLKEGKEAALKLPYYWAGITYYGSNSLVNLKKKRDAFPLWGLLALPVLLIIAFVAVRKRWH